MKTSKEMIMENLDDAIKNCNKMVELGSKTNAAFYRGVAEGLVTAMFFSELIEHAEYTKLCDIIFDTIKQEGE